MNIEQIRALVRAEFAESGIAATPPAEIRASLVDSAQGVGTQAADILYLMLNDCQDPGQETFNKIVDATLEAALTLLAVFFAEFGQDEHPDHDTARERAREGYFARLNVLGLSGSAGGAA